jgi:hypothetical protein
VRFPVRVERFAVPGAEVFLDDLGMLDAPGVLVGRAGGLVEVAALAGEGRSACWASRVRGRRVRCRQSARGVSTGMAPGLGWVLSSSSRWPRLPAPRTSGSALSFRWSAEPAGGDHVRLVPDGLDECPSRHPNNTNLTNMQAIGICSRAGSPH